MKTTLRVEGEITEDGHLLVDLPPDLVRGRVVVTLKPLPEKQLELTEEDLEGVGLTANKIALSPEIGAWAEDREVQSGAEYVENLRGSSPRYSW